MLGQKLLQHPISTSSGQHSWAAAPRDEQSHRALSPSPSPGRVLAEHPQPRGASRGAAPRGWGLLSPGRKAAGAAPSPWAIKPGRRRGAAELQG